MLQLFITLHSSFLPHCPYYIRFPQFPAFGNIYQSTLLANSFTSIEGQAPDNSKDRSSLNFPHVSLNRVMKQLYSNNQLKLKNQIQPEGAETCILLSKGSGPQMLLVLLWLYWNYFRGRILMEFLYSPTSQIFMRFP